MTELQGSPDTSTAPEIGDQVIFDEADGVHTSSLGVVSRISSSGRYVVLVSDGRTFARLTERVIRCA